VRTRWGLSAIIATGFVFLLGSALALAELGTSHTTCRTGSFRAGLGVGPVCTSTGGTSPVVYAILIVAIVIGVICLAAGITVLAVRTSAPEGTAAPVPLVPVGGVPLPSGGGIPQASGGATPPGWYPVAPGGPQRWWDGSRWVLTQAPPSE
jgi:multisubunit Na+/H+ antiporter MnhC subunit